MSDSEFLTADAAAHLLGVTRQTLYAYVSRGLIRSQPGPGPSRARWYPRGAVEALLRARVRTPGERALAGAMQWGAPVLESALTLIDGGRLYYRGRDVIALSREASLEHVASILWTDGEVAAQMLFASVPPARPGRTSRPPTPILAGMEGALVKAAHQSLASVSSPTPARLRAAAEIVGLLFASAGAVGSGRMATRLARGWRTPDDGAIAAALVLCADHELNVSAFTARCIASSDARLEHVLLGALCAFQGRRHGGLGARVHAMLDDADRSGADGALERVLAEQGEVPGFGHPLYAEGDPRAVELLRLAPSPDHDDHIVKLQQTCEVRLNLKPNLDFGLAAFASRLELPPGAGAAIFALGRSIGWIAHAFEAWDDESLIRPRARYVGPVPRSVTTSGE